MVPPIGTAGDEGEPDEALPPNVVLITLDTTRADRLGCRALFGKCGFEEAEHVVFRKQRPE